MNTDLYSQPKENKRKINLQNIYREMLNNQVEVKRNREMKIKQEDLQQERFIVNNNEPRLQTIQICDYLPHEWNDPGMRYLRKSLSSVGYTSSNGMNYSYNISDLNRSLDHEILPYSSGKKTMLEPLQNYETRKKFK